MATERRKESKTSSPEFGLIESWFINRGLGDQSLQNQVIILFYNTGPPRRLALEKDRISANLVCCSVGEQHKHIEHHV